jgi:hypothetical protein
MIKINYYITTIQNNTIFKRIIKENNFKKNYKNKNIFHQKEMKIFKLRTNCSSLSKLMVIIVRKIWKSSKVYIDHLLIIEGNEKDLKERNYDNLYQEENKNVKKELS